MHLEARPEVEVSGNGNRFRSSLFPFPFRFPVLQQRLLRLLRLRLRQRVASLVCRRSFLNKFNLLFFDLDTTIDLKPESPIQTVFVCAISSSDPATNLARVLLVVPETQRERERGRKR